MNLRLIRRVSIWLIAMLAFYFTDVRDFAKKCLVQVIFLRWFSIIP